MHLFYTPDINTSTYTLSEEESKHCIKVLRLVEGDRIYLVDGRGGFYETHIIEAHPKRCMVQVLDVKLNYGKRNYYLHLAISPLKSLDRFEWFLEKATELGIDEITPIITQRSEKREIKLERCNKIIEAAMKQSKKAFHPKLNDYIAYPKFINNNSDDESIKLIAHCLDAEKKKLTEIFNTEPRKYLILIGPEGDFTEKEIKMAADKKFDALDLGEARLRTETAAIKACALIAFINEN
jgi:16S rRNA (uracil1498-N3)-methyltransferase